MMMKTRLTELLKIEMPIIQGGLAHLAYAELAAAVSNAGGLGQITAMSLDNEDALREEIQKVKKLTDKPFGVNFAIGQHGRPFEHMVQVALDENVPVISVTGGNPKPVLEMFQGTNTKKLVLVAARRQAEKAEELGADAVMVVGYEGGGHLGRDHIGNFVLIPEVVQAVDIPVVASGGISDGKGLMAALSFGAEGIEMGTRFIATKECVHASEAYKQAILDAGAQSTVLIKESIGAPARALKNDWTDKILELEQKNVGYEGLKDYISGKANKRFAQEGQVDEGFVWAGKSAWRIQDLPSVQELFDQMVDEVDEIQQRLTQITTK